MNEHLKLFSSQQAQTSYETGSTYVQPYLSLVEGETTVNYDVEILSDRKNPAVWNVIKEQGWNSNPNYLTKAEAAAVTTFPNNLFDRNTEITSFNELAYFTSLTMIPHYCFCDCTNLKEVTLPPNVNEIGRLSFGIRGSSYNNGLRSSLENIYNLSQVEYYHSYCFGCCYKLKLNENSFLGLKYIYSMKEGYDPESQGITHDIENVQIENGSLLNVVRVKRLNMPNATGLLYQSFFRNIHISEVYVGNNCKQVHNYCFGQQNAYSGYHPVLKKVDIGTGVEFVVGKAFNQAHYLETVIIRTTTPPEMYQIDGTYDLNPSGNYKLYVPDQSVQTYKEAEGWSTFAHRIHPLSEIEPNN